MSRSTGSSVQPHVSTTGTAAVVSSARVPGVCSVPTTSRPSGRRPRKLRTAQHPNMPVIIEHVTEDEVPAAKEFVHGALVAAGV